MGGKKTVNVNEGARISAFHACKANPSKSLTDNGSLYINKQKFAIVAYLDDIDATYIKGKGNYGGAIVGTNTALVVGIFDNTKNSALSKGGCNLACEKLAKQLMANGS